jgi:L-ascorbate metabolism protein UlaG (beta-lactamase superfamily)
VEVTSSGAPARTRITFIGHSTVLLEDGGLRLLTDPLLRDRAGPLVRERSQRGRALELATRGGRPDAVLISHMHRDHFDAPSLRALGPELRMIVPPGGTALARRAGAGEAQELDVGASTRVGELDVRAVPAIHGGARNLVGPSVATQGYMVSGASRTYFAGDTDLFDGMSELGPIDVALIPVWGWGTGVGTGHLDPRSAARAVALLRPRVAIPIHWGTLHPLGRRRSMLRHLVEPPREFARRAAHEWPQTEVKVLEPGDAIDL